MFRTTVFISMVILAAASVSLAQPSLGGGQFSCFGGGGITSAAHYGCLSSDVDTGFSTGGQGDFDTVGPCDSIGMYQSNSYFIDQGSAAGGVGGISTASGSIYGGGTQGQVSSYIPSQCAPTCFSYGEQSQTLGGMGTDSVLTTCGHNGAAVSQAAAGSEFQSIQTPSTGGSQYQYMAGMQGGQAVGNPTSFATAGGMVSGTAVQSQSFGGLSPF